MNMHSRFNPLLSPDAAAPAAGTPAPQTSQTGAQPQNESITLAGDDLAAYRALAGLARLPRGGQTETLDLATRSAHLSPKSYADEVANIALAQLRKETARSKHGESYAAFTKRITEKAKELADGDEFLTELLGSHLRVSLESLRTPYGDDHPLAGEALGIPDDEAIEKYLTEKKLTDSLKAWRGKQVGDLGRRAIAGAKATAAAPNTNNTGKQVPEDEDSRIEQRRARDRERLAAIGITGD